MSGKRLIVFDLDGTLAESKSPIDEKMGVLLGELLAHRQVAVISGSPYEYFEMNLVRRLPPVGESLRNLFLFPTCATRCYEFNGSWACAYMEKLTVEEKKKIFDAFAKALAEVGFEEPENVYGDIIEDRETQISFSAFGQRAPLELKKGWDPDFRRRRPIQKALLEYLPDFEVKIGGTTTIDVTRKGVDKAYGIAQMEKRFGISKEEMLFVGDTLFEGGNDYPVKESGVESIQVSGPRETKEVIRSLLAGFSS